MSHPERVPFVGGPLDGKDYEWTTSNAVLVPDAADRIFGYDPKADRWCTLFGEHTYEMKCYAKDGEKRYQLEHAGYKKPVLPKGWIEWKDLTPEVK